MRKCFCILILLSGIGCLAVAQNDQLIDTVFASWAEDGSPGGAIAVLKDGEILYREGFGMASLEYGIPITAETVFNIASVSKQFTAFSMILLSQQGKLNLDDDIRKYVPEVPEFGETITIRHLAHHISGLRNFQNLLTMAGWREGDAMSNEDLLKYIRWQRDLNFPVGSEYLYCNTGYNLMATIVERVTGQSFIEWTKENIFLPLDMNQSTFRNDMTEVVENTATSYDLSDGGGYSQPRPFWDYMGNGNIYTTVEDLTKWMTNFSTHKLGGSEGYDQLIQRGVLISGDTIGYAFGIGVGSYRGQSVLQHGGSIGGYRSSMAYFPDQKFGIVILSNFSSGNPGGKLWQVADMYLEDVLDERIKSPSFEAEFSTVPVDITDEVKARMIGHFDMEDYLVELYLEDETLMARASDSPPLVVTPTSDSTFYLADVGFHIIFHSNSDHQYNEVSAYTPELDKGVRIFPEWRNIENLMPYVGSYHSPELKTTYTMVVNKGILEMRHPRHNSFEIIPIDEKLLKGDVWFFNEIDVKRNGLGEVTGLYVSNGRVRNLWFEKISF